MTYCLSGQTPMAIDEVVWSADHRTCLSSLNYVTDQCAHKLKSRIVILKPMESGASIPPRAMKQNFPPPTRGSTDPTVCMLKVLPPLSSRTVPPSLLLSCPSFPVSSLPLLLGVWGYNPRKNFDLTDARRWVLVRFGHKNQHLDALGFVP